MIVRNEPAKAMSLKEIMSMWLSIGNPKHKHPPDENACNPSQESSGGDPDENPYLLELRRIGTALETIAENLVWGEEEVPEITDENINNYVL